MSAIDVQAIYDSYIKDDLSLTDVAAKFSIGRNRLQRLFREAGLPTRKGFVLDAEAVAQLHKRYVTGLSLAVVADEVGLSGSSVVRRMFQEHGLPIRKRGEVATQRREVRERQTERKASPKPKPKPPQPKRERPKAKTGPDAETMARHLERYIAGSTSLRDIANELDLTYPSYETVRLFRHHGFHKRKPPTPKPPEPEPELDPPAPEDEPKPKRPLVILSPRQRAKNRERYEQEVEAGSFTTRTLTEDDLQRLEAARQRRRPSPVRLPTTTPGVSFV